MNFNWKALVIGVLALLILSFATSLLTALYLPEAYSSFVSSGRVPGLHVAYLVLATLLQFGLPAYLAAWIAKRSYVLHGLVVGVAGTVILLVVSVADSGEHVAVSIVTYGASILIAAAAGKLRKYQVGHLSP